MLTMIRASLFFVTLSISAMTASSHARMDDSDVSPERLTASMSRQADLDKSWTTGGQKAKLGSPMPCIKAFARRGSFAPAMRSIAATVYY
jgi:hypothetical protein